MQDRLAPLKDVASELAQGAIDILSDQQRWQRMSDACAAVARDKLWTWEARMAAEVAEIERLLERHP